MGSRMVQNLLQQNYSVVVFNRTVDKVSDLLDQGATYAETPRKAAEQADIVISMVTNDHVSRILWFDPEIGAAAGLSNRAIAIEFSTLTVIGQKN